MTEYKLQTDVTYYVTSDHGVLFIEPGRKILANKASSWLFRTGHKTVKSGIMRTGQEFEIEFRKNRIWVKHPKLMGGKEYFEVLDQTEENLLEIVQNIDIVNHKPNAKFELLTSEAEYGSSVGYHPYLSCPGMKSYNEAWDEFVRTVNIQRKPRTKKLVPGHRYDTPGSTLWCLGDFNGTLGFVASKGKATKISELMEGLRRVVKVNKTTNIKNYDGYHESDLLLLEHPGLMTDSGEDLETDWTDPIYKFWPDWLNGSKIDGRKDFLKLYNLLSITQPSDKSRWPEWEAVVKPELEKALSEYLLQVYIDFESRDCCGHKLKTALSDKDFIKETKEIFTYSWPGNRESAQGCLSFMESHGVDLDKIILESRATFGQINFGTLENLLKYQSRFLALDRKTYERTITFHDDQENDGGQIRGLFHNQVLSETVVEMLKLAQENLGLVSELFSYLGVYQYNRRMVPDLNIKLSLQNIIDYIGGLDALTESFKEALVAEKFLALDINLKRSLIIL